MLTLRLALPALAPLRRAAHASGRASIRRAAGAPERPGGHRRRARQPVDRLRPGGGAGRHRRHASRPCSPSRASPTCWSAWASSYLPRAIQVARTPPRLWSPPRCPPLRNRACTSMPRPPPMGDSRRPARRHPGAHFAARRRWPSLCRGAGAGGYRRLLDGTRRQQPDRQPSYRGTGPGRRHRGTSRALGGAARRGPPAAAAQPTSPPPRASPMPSTSATPAPPAPKAPVWWRS